MPPIEPIKDSQTRGEALEQEEFYQKPVIKNA
jgi:hypothetical protein